MKSTLTKFVLGDVAASRWWPELALSR